jgi:SulP family sulfate permease
MSETARKHEEKTGGIRRVLPILGWLPAYKRAWVKGDLIAGLSVWALMVPASMGYATISGVPVQYGLYAAAFGLFAFALFTTSKQVTVGPSSSTAAVLGAAVLAVAAAGSDQAIIIASSIVLVAGLLYVIMYLFKMGWISEFLSTSVLTGFTFGIAINVTVGELFKITGTESSGSNTWQELWAWISSLPESNMATLVVGVSALILLFGFKLLAPKVPGALVVVALGIAATALFNLDDLGVELIAAVPTGLPSIVLPDLTLILDNLALIVGAAVGLVLIGFSVTTASIRDFATKYNYKVDVNQELLAQGMSNVSSSLVQGIYVNGSLSKSPVADNAGAKSQIYNLAQAFFIILTLLFLAPLFSYLPEAVLGAIIIEAVVMELMNVGEMKRIYAVKRYEFWIALAALLGVVTFGILPGVVIGIALSIIWLVAVSARPEIPELGRKPGTHAFFDLLEHPESQTYPGLSILRFDGGLFFVNSNAIGDRLRHLRIHADPPLKGLILSMEGVNFIDVQGADMLKKLAESGLDLGIDFHLARVKPQVLEVLQRNGVYDMITNEFIHEDIDEAVELHMRNHPLEAADAQDSRDS